MNPVTIADLARLKGISEYELRQFGLSDSPEGVRFSYRFHDGTEARTRIRAGLRGASGSRWEIAEAPITAYTPPTAVATRLSQRLGLLIVEGESDCWAAWHHGLFAIGIPGAKQVEVINANHLERFHLVAIQRENNTSLQTFPGGVDSFIQNVASRSRRVGFEGKIVAFSLNEEVSDLSELHIANPNLFVKQVTEAVSTGQTIRGVDA